MKRLLAKSAIAVAVVAASSSATMAATISLDGDIGTLGLSSRSIPDAIKSPGTPFTFGWSFSVADPYVAISGTLNWNPNDAISNFSGTLYSVTNCTTGAGSNPPAPFTNGTAGTCETVSQIASFTQASVNSYNLPSSGRLEVPVGKYAFYFTGTTPNDVGDYTFNGSASARVPAPAALGLLGIGLFGIGLTRRRNGVATA